MKAQILERYNAQFGNCFFAIEEHNTVRNQFLKFIFYGLTLTQILACKRIEEELVEAVDEEYFLRQFQSLPLFIRRELQQTNIRITKIAE